MPYEIKYAVEYYFVDEDGNPIPNEVATRLFIDALTGEISADDDPENEDGDAQ